jgi:putative phosphonate metabolism protein
MTARYAIYYAPDAESSLWQKASAWLGRNAAADCALAFPSIEGIDTHMIAEITAAPRTYGFHATIVAPFRLAAGQTLPALCAAADAFAASRARFAAPLQLSGISGFLAMIVAHPVADMDALHAASLAAFDPFRAPLGEADLARRLQVPLTDRQRRYLHRWGYPYVLEDFRFHLTLTGCLGPEERALVAAALADYLAEELRAPLSIDALSIFEQPAPGQPFTVVHRAAFADS